MEAVKELLFGQPILGIAVIFIAIMIVKSIIKFSIKVALTIFVVLGALYYFMGINILN